jgi:hypothetical protein
LASSTAASASAAASSAASTASSASTLASSHTALISALQTQFSAPVTSTGTSGYSTLYYSVEQQLNAPSVVSTNTGYSLLYATLVSSTGGANGTAASSAAIATLQAQVSALNTAVYGTSSSYSAPALSISTSSGAFSFPVGFTFTAPSTTSSTLLFAQWTAYTTTAGTVTGTLTGPATSASVTYTTPTTGFHLCFPAIAIQFQSTSSTSTSFTLTNGAGAWTSDLNDRIYWSAITFKSTPFPVLTAATVTGASSAWSMNFNAVAGNSALVWMCGTGQVSTVGFASNSLVLNGATTLGVSNMYFYATSWHQTMPCAWAYATNLNTGVNSLTVSASNMASNSADTATMQALVFSGVNLPTYYSSNAAGPASNWVLSFNAPANTRTLVWFCPVCCTLPRARRCVQIHRGG